MPPAGERCLDGKQHSSYFNHALQMVEPLSVIAHLTRPQMQSIKAIGVKVISHAVAPPAFSSSWVGAVALSHSPPHTQVGCLCRHKGLDMVDHNFIVPLLILGGPLARTQENVGSDTEGKSEGSSNNHTKMTGPLRGLQYFKDAQSTW